MLDLAKYPLTQAILAQRAAQEAFPSSKDPREMGGAELIAAFEYEANGDGFADEDGDRPYASAKTLILRAELLRRLTQGAA